MADLQKKSGSVWPYVVWFALAGVGLLAAYGLVTAVGGVEWWGPFGDSLAPVTGLLSAVALGAAIASVVMQTRELRAALAEHQQSRAAQEKLAAATERANEVAERTAIALEAANDASDDRLRWDKKALDVRVDWNRAQVRASLVNALVQIRAAQVAAAAAERPGGSNPVPSSVTKTMESEEDRIRELLRELAPGPRPPVKPRFG